MLYATIRRVVSMLLSASLLLVCGVSAAVPGKTAAGKNFTNPVTPNGRADPFVLRWNGRYYLYCTPSTTRLHCWTSLDLVHWEDAGVCADDSRVEGAYAPEVVYYNGLFYMYTSPKGNGHYILRSESPTGPFTVISDNMGRGIDGDVFIDDDGKWYFLTSGGSCITRYEMTGPAAFGEAVSVPAATMNGRWTEGPMCLKIGGRYYLTFTGNHFLHKGYRVGVASGVDLDHLTLQTPTMLLSTSDAMYGVGHSSSVKGPNLDSYYIVYHSLTYENQQVDRVANIDRLVVSGDQMEVLGPTTIPQPLPQLPDLYAYFDGTETGWSGGRVSDGVLRLEEGKTAVQETPIQGDFTAEVCLAGMDSADGQAGVLFSYVSPRTYGSALLNGQKQTLDVKFRQDGRLVAVESFPLPASFGEPVRMDCVQSIQIERWGQEYTFFFHDRQVGVVTLPEGADFSAGRIGLTAQKGAAAFSYVGATGAVRGADLKRYPKPVPGRLRAETCLEPETLPPETEAKELAISPDQPYSYAVQVEKDGYYDLSVCYRSEGEATLTLLLDGQPVAAGRLPAMEQGGVQMLRRIPLRAGYHTLSVAWSGAAPSVAYYDWTACDPVATLEAPLDASDLPSYSDGPWTAEEGALRLPDDREAARGYGKRLYGDDGWADYTVEATVTPLTDANCGLLLRATHPDSGIFYYEDQSQPAAEGTDFVQGYFVGLGTSGLLLGKQNYNWRVLQSREMPVSVGTEYRLKTVCEGPRIQVYVDDVLCLDYTDPEPYLHGRVGMRTHNCAVRYTRFTVTPICTNLRGRLPYGAELARQTDPSLLPPAEAHSLTQAMEAAQAVLADPAAGEEALGGALDALWAAMFPSAAPLPGDLNADGDLTVADVVLLRRAILASAATEDQPAGDLNADAQLTVADVVLLRRNILSH